MGAQRSALFVVKPSARTATRQDAFNTGERIPQSGIYKVIHADHRLPHEVTLIKDEEFPRCAKCQDAVVFELVRGVAIAEEILFSSPQIRLYELPDLDDMLGLAG